MDGKTNVNADELYHYGVKGMRWGVRRARKENKKIDDSFKNWNENSAKKANAIDLGKQANVARMEYERNSKDRNAKRTYKTANKEYKKALRGNTTYRKGDIRKEVGQDMSRKYLSESKKIQKQLNNDPDNKQLQKQYKYLSDQHQYERAKARKAPEVAQKRSARKAAIKRQATITAKTAVTGAAITGGVMVANKYLESHNVTVNGKAVNIKKQNVHDAMRYVNAGREFLKFFY